MRRRGGWKFSGKSSNVFQIRMKSYCGPKLAPFIIDRNQTHRMKENCDMYEVVGKSLERLSRYRRYGTVFANKTTSIIQIPGTETEKHSTRHSCILRPILLSSALCLVYHTFLHYVINGTIWAMKFIEHKMCYFVSSTNFVWCISHRKGYWVRHGHTRA